jgi:hypothetical protein
MSKEAYLLPPPEAPAPDLVMAPRKIDTVFTEKPDSDSSGLALSPEGITGIIFGIIVVGLLCWGLVILYNRFQRHAASAKVR